MSFIDELKRRNVFKVSAAYLALGWVIIEISGTVVPALRLPPWTTSLLLWLGLAGLPFVVIFSWIFELTPEGLKREAEVDRSSSITHVTGRRLDYTIIGLMVLAIALFALDRFGSGSGAVAAPPVVSAAPQAPDAVEAEVRDDKSIAVLPFANMSDDKDNEYFGDGLAEELLNLLAKVPELRVAARTSSFHFKGKNPTIAEVAAALQVDTVLEGSVRRSGDTIRVVAQLISAKDGTHLWSEKYDRPLTDIFKLQDDIADHIVKALLPHLGAQGPVLAKSDSGDISPELFERFLWARHRYYDKSPAALAEAQVEFLAISRAAPDYAPGWAWLARSWLSVAEEQGGETPDEVAHQRAQEAIDTALRLAPKEAHAQLALGLLLRREDRLREAEAALDRALELDPSLVDAHIGRNRLLGASGRPDEAIAELQAARALDPLHPEVLYDLAHLLNLQGRKREAFAAVDRLYEINPASARELELHLYSDSNAVARELYLSELTFREDSKDLKQDWLAWAFVAYGIYDHPVLKGSLLEPLALALRGEKDAARAALAVMESAPTVDPDALDARVDTRVVLGEEKDATGMLWQAWTDAGRKLGSRFHAGYASALIALLQRTGRAEEATAVVDTLEAEIAKWSPLHSANLLVFKYRIAAARGDSAGALEMLGKLADSGYTGNRFLGTTEGYAWSLEGDPGLKPVLARIDANHAAQMAELERLRASGMDATAARRDYVSRLP